MPRVISTKTVRLGDLVAAAFDEATGIARNHAAAARLAARIVTTVLVRAGNAPVLRTLYGPVSKIERVATRSGRVRCQPTV